MIQFYTMSIRLNRTFFCSTAAKAADIASSDYVISPLTGEKIPANKIQEHMRIGKRTF